MSLELYANGDDDLSVSAFERHCSTVRGGSLIQNSFGRNDVTGYVEGDFSGNDTSGVYQSVNGHTNRLRLYFMDLRRGTWEFLGGQTWRWPTPNRTGLGAMPSDLAVTYNEDQNIGVGLP